MRSELWHACAVKLRSMCRSRQKPFRYSEIYNLDFNLLINALRTDTDWDSLRDSRSLVRARAGIFVLCHRGGKRSQARIQYCIFCGASTKQIDAYPHVFLQCVHCHAGRAAVLSSCGEPARVNHKALFKILATCPGDAGFNDVCALCATIDKTAADFWRRL